MITGTKVIPVLGGLLILLFLAQNLIASISQTDNLGVPVPSQNGTSNNLNITMRMQQYVGFYGNVTSVVRLNTTNTTSFQLYNKPVTTGMLYFVKSGATLTGAIVPAINNSWTDANYSLTGFYTTGNQFTSNGTICGTESVDYLNTTDGYGVGIFRDSGANHNHFLCTDIRQMNSVQGFGNIGFEVVVPKTSTYVAYDVYVDLE